MLSFNEIFFRNFLKVLTALIIILSFLYILKPFIVPLVFAGILAMAFSPLLSKIMRKWKLGRLKSLIIMITAIFLLAGVPTVVFFIRGSKLLKEFFSKKSFNQITENAVDKVNFYVDKFADNGYIDVSDLKSKLIEILDTFSTFIFKTISNFLGSIPDLILAFIILAIAFICFLLEEEKIRSIFDKFFFFKDRKGSLFIKRLKTSCREVFLSNVVTGSIQSSIVAIGALICGIGDFYIIFVITFICSFIPVIGAAPMAFLLGILSFIDGKIGAGVTMCVIGGISGVADNVIRPYLNSKGEVEVPAFVGFLAVIGGVIVLGLPGLFIGPLLASLMYGVIPIILSEYFPEHNLMNNKNYTKITEEKVTVEVIENQPKE